jgi:hypothetical protein
LWTKPVISEINSVVIVGKRGAATARILSVRVGWAAADMVFSF